MARTRRKIARLAIRRVKKQNSQNTKRKLKTLRSRKHAAARKYSTSKSRMNYHEMSGGGANTEYAIYVLKTQREVCCILLIEQGLTVGKLPNVCIFYDSNALTTRNQVHDSNAWRLLGLWLNDIIVEILGGQSVVGADGAGQTKQIDDNFSYCVMITRTSTFLGGFKEEIYGFDRTVIAPGTDLLKIDKDKRIPVGLPDSAPKELKTQFPETLKTLDESKIVKILTDFATRETTVNSGPSVDYVDYKDPKIRLVSFERTGVLNLNPKGELKLEDVEGLFKTENEKIRASISQKCKATEGIKLLAKFVKVVEFNKAAESILFNKADVSSPIYEKPEPEFETAKAELIAEITSLHESKYEGITFSENDKTQLVEWLDRREICRDEIEELDKQHWAATNFAYIGYSEDRHFPQRLRNVVRANTLWTSIEGIVSTFIEAIKRFRALPAQ